MFARYAKLVEHILDREVSWRLWKDSHKCQPFEKPPLEVPAAGTKRKLAETGAGAGSRSEAAGTEAMFKGKALDLGRDSIGIRKQRLGFQEHFSLFLDAEDPEQGIDDEYHPKHDKKYCWRATRLLMKSRCAKLMQMPGGDLTAVAKDPEIAKRELVESTGGESAMKD